MPIHSMKRYGGMTKSAEVDILDQRVSQKSAKKEEVILLKIRLMKNDEYCPIIRYSRKVKMEKK